MAFATAAFDLGSIVLFTKVLHASSNDMASGILGSICSLGSLTGPLLLTIFFQNLAPGLRS